VADIESILRRLASSRSERGWSQFLAAYSDLIYQVVHEFEDDGHLAEDCYLHVCSQLADSGFKRLLNFRVDGPARFETWLRVVVTRLCLDWRRAEYGRFRPFRVVQKLPALQRELFELRFRHGLALHECFLNLKTNDPTLTRTIFTRENSELNQALSSEQHSRLGARARRPLSLDDVTVRGEITPRSADSDPEQHLQMEQERLRLEQAMARLEPLQRLLIRLRYQHELTLQEVARLGGLDNLHSASRHLKIALTTLGELLEN